MGACAALGISNQDGLSENLENNSFLNSALQRFTCELYYRFGSFLAPLSVGLITSRHYLSDITYLKAIKMEEGAAKIQSKCEVLGAVITFGVIGFWFGIGATLTVKMVQSVKELISIKCQ